MAEPTSEAVLGTLHYLARIPLYDIEKPFEAIIDLSRVPGARHTNHQHEDVENVAITDIKASGLKPDLDKEGFQFETLPDLPDPDFDNYNWITESYYAHIEDFLRSLLGAKEVLIFEHQLRYRHPGFGDNRSQPGGDFAAPVPVVHADQTKDAARRRFYRHWPGFSDADWTTHRWQIINVWRPLNDVVSEWPLAVCDCRTVDEQKDLRGSDLIRSDYVGESCLSFFNPKHAWYFANNQTHNEAWVLKLYDSKPDVASSRSISISQPSNRHYGLLNLMLHANASNLIIAVLHTAFDIGTGAGGRKSCEVRALVRR